MQRVIVPSGRCHSEEVTAGVFIERFYPGGKDGPNGECLYETPGGQGWTDYVLLGDPQADVQMLWPDIRLPANQYWPLHWHDCWTAVIILEGICLMGDWWMQPGDIFITGPGIEYGPLVPGPRGTRLFEIFSDAARSAGGYAPEYRDHPTLQGSARPFADARSDLNKRNNGRMTLPCDGVDRAFKSRLSPGASWNLGEPDDPDRGVLSDTLLVPGEIIAPHSYGDWHMIAVLDGALEFSGRTLARDGFLRIAPDSPVGAIRAGPNGARLLEGCRTSRGLERRPIA